MIAVYLLVFFVGTLGGFVTCALLSANRGDCDECRLAAEQLRGDTGDES